MTGHPKDPVEWRAPIAIGCAAGLLIYLTLAGRVIPNADEGIYLQGGVNLLRGQIPYRDFFMLTGPGNLWLVAALLRLGGITLRTARVLPAFDISLMTALTFWLVSRFAGRAAALGTSVLLLAVCLSSPGNVVVNHRWDSSAFALAAVSAALFAMQTERRGAAALSGVLAVLAAWITPSTFLVAMVIAAWFLSDRRAWRLGQAYAAGAAACILVPAALMANQRAMLPMIESLYWTATHYSQANRSAYGAVFGGTAGLFAGAHGAQLAVRILLLAPFLLPALLPPLVTAAWLPAMRSPRRPEFFLLLCGGALVASAYPRWDLLHLLYVSPLFFVLAGLRIARGGGQAQVALLLLLLIPAAAMCVHSLMGDGTEFALATPIGRIHLSKSEAPSIQMALSNIRPGDSLFVFPYEPFFYFLTGGQNPTRYLWLQPGMMSAEDERTALAELDAKPPQWILYRDVAPGDYLRIWPGSDPARLRMSSIEAWLRTNYRHQASAPSPDGVRELWRRQSQR
ncbi:MAG TPA: hypothetical protein VGF49_08155 [Candidatus Solibacter sp.]